MCIYSYMPVNDDNVTRRKRHREIKGASSSLARANADDEDPFGSYQETK